MPNRAIRSLADTRGPPSEASSIAASNAAIHAAATGNSPSSNRIQP